ncbi:MAG: hypothetical protein AAGJ31_07935, partial [Verrucomicrobiota bacterium]
MSTRPLVPIVIVVLLQTAIILFLFQRWRASTATGRLGPVIHEETSSYSHLRVRESGRRRTLTFVSPDGSEQIQSSIDLDVPHQLQLRYSKALFLSLLYQFPQERILIVGLGGGGMVRFAQHALPDTVIEAIEIDPAVVSVADHFFGTRSGGRVHVHTADAFDFFQQESHGPFDVIYLDAFLKPTVNPNASENTKRLKTVSFLQDMRSQLAPGGLLAVNLIEADPSTAEDLETF